MPAVVLWLSDRAPKPTRQGCSHLLTDGGEESEGRGGAGGGWGPLGLSYFPLAVVFWVLDDAPKLTPWGGRSHLLKEGGGEVGGW